MLLVFMEFLTKQESGISMGDYKKFKKDTKKIKKFVKKWFGKRCPDIDERCECCRRWHYVSNLIENPFDKGE